METAELESATPCMSTEYDSLYFNGFVFKCVRQVCHRSFFVLRFLLGEIDKIEVLGGLFEVFLVGVCIDIFGRRDIFVAEDILEGFIVHLQSRAHCRIGMAAGVRCATFYEFFGEADGFKCFIVIAVSPVLIIHFLSVAITYDIFAGMIEEILENGKHYIGHRHGSVHSFFRLTAAVEASVIIIGFLH